MARVLVLSLVLVSFWTSAFAGSGNNGKGNGNNAVTASPPPPAVIASPPPPGTVTLSPAGQNNNNGNGNGVSATVIDWYNDQEYPTCPLQDCPPLKFFCSGGMCNDTAGILGRWRLPVQSSLQCPPGSSIPKPNNQWCIENLTVSQCCEACSKSAMPCRLWQHYIGTINPSGKCLKCGICWLYPPGDAPKCETQLDNNNGYRIKYNCSRIGASCPYTKNDPHFRGAHGTRFEFNGLPDKSFCLVTDRRVHLNMRMHGYLDDRTVGASIIRAGKAVRTWIRELGLIWREDSAAAGEAGREHKFRMVARRGTQQERAEGFVERLEVDGAPLPRMHAGERLNLPGGLELTFVGVQMRGPMEVDAYHVSIPDLIELDVKLRVAHPLLQTADDAEAHINLAFRHVQTTKDIHGVMGQTYRSGREQRAMDYTALSALLHRPVAVDSEQGAGFLDGSLEDYETSDVLKPDCRYSAFLSGRLPS
ncbi:hypothetical protein CLOM_g3427 [Closterium sp. NIES-68]|nr:hypothetical protein CLOM_g3427 [Closterium sp. NIES-68]GJP65734.1 hypothetical protein CLOP_g22597 [Closterium sp. NIES-67]